MAFCVQGGVPCTFVPWNLVRRKKWWIKKQICPFPVLQKSICNHGEEKISNTDSLNYNLMEIAFMTSNGPYGLHKNQGNHEEIDTN